MKTDGMKEAELRKMAGFFKILSVESRIRMVELLKARPFCVNALANHLGITPAAVSQHLRILREADLVIPEKRGYFVHYRINEKTLHLWHEEMQKLLSPLSEEHAAGFLQGEDIPLCPDRSTDRKG